jgi:rubrerythrin
MSSPSRPTLLDRLLQPVHKWVWCDQDRRIRKLTIFGEVETDGGRDILRAAEVTPDPLLRRLYLEHAIDELRHGVMFRERAETLLRARGARSKGLFSGNPLPGGHGLDDLVVEDQGDPRLLAFLHIAEKTAAGRFAIYKECVNDDPTTREIFEHILRDEVFHMNYSYQQLGRLTPELRRRHVWRARGRRLWNRYLRVAATVAGLLGNVILLLLYFVALPPFAWLAKRAERREPAGWRPIPSDQASAPTSQY